MVQICSYAQGYAYGTIWIWFEALKKSGKSDINYIPTSVDAPVNTDTGGTGVPAIFLTTITGFFFTKITGNFR
jgi:hypothetical protein